jgi:D-glycero-D-manno-heptose 1,7-bisphosphate phosphatase
VLIENRPDYVRTLEQVVFIPGAAPAIAAFNHSFPNVPVIVASNQAGVGRGLIAPETVAAINAAIQAHVHAAGGRITAFYICPHRADENCPCRKPKPGLLFNAAAEHTLQLAESVMIGDSATDVLAAQAAGAQPLFVQTGLSERLIAEQNYAEQLGASIHINLAAAIQFLLAQRALA